MLYLLRIDRGTPSDLELHLVLGTVPSGVHEVVDSQVELERVRRRKEILVGPIRTVREQELYQCIDEVVDLPELQPSIC